MKACGHSGFIRGLLVAAVAAMAAPWVSVSAAPVADNVFRSPLQLAAPRGATPISSPLTAVTAAGKHLVAVGQRGDIVYSDDRGKQWTQASVPVSADLTSVSFPTDKLGWAVGQNGVILHSGDGGKSWSVQMTGLTLAKRLVTFYEHKLKAAAGGGAEDPTVKRALRKAKYLAGNAPALALLDVWFRNAKVGFVVGEFNIILKTVNGGQTWTPLGYEVPTRVSHHLYSIRGVSGSLYIAGERGLLLRRDVGADAFKVIPTPYEGSFFGVVVGGGVIVIYGLQGHAYLSRDDGGTWQRLRTTTQSSFVAGVLNGSHLVLATLSGQLFVGDVGDVGNADLEDLDGDGGDAVYGLTAVGSDAVLAVGPSRPRVISLGDSQ